jgi:hypothetical protein
VKKEVLLALVDSLVNDALNKYQDENPVLRGPRGQRGPRGFSGEFNYEEHSDKIFTSILKAVEEKSEALKLKFEDLTADEISALKGRSGRDGKSVSIEDVIPRLQEYISEISDDLKIKFSDLTEEEIKSIQGPRGPRGQRGLRGLDFNYEDHKDIISSSILNAIESKREELKLSFSDLSVEEKQSLKLTFNDLTEDERLSLRGPRGLRGQKGKEGKDFNYEEHASRIAEEIRNTVLNESDSLKLTFNDLSEDEKESLKLTFSDLTEDDKSQIRGTRGLRGQKGKQGEPGERGEKGEKGDKGDSGPRGLRGQKGKQGETGERGENGEKGDIGPRGIRGLQGATGATGIQGIQGEKGEKGDRGQDAPKVTEIEAVKVDAKSILLKFYYDDGTVLRTNEFKLPTSQVVQQLYAAGFKADVSIEKDGTEVGISSTLNFTGDNVTVTDDGDKIIIDIGGEVVAESAQFLTVTRVLDENCSQYKLVSASSGTNIVIATHADTDKARVLGMALEAGNTGDSIKVLLFGNITNGFSFGLNKHLYLQAGDMTETPPSPPVGVTWYITEVAFSNGSGSVFINPKSPLEITG